MTTSFSTLRKTLRVSAITLAVSLLAACGGGGNGSSDPAQGYQPPKAGEKAEGVFMDAAVSGIDVWQDGKLVSTTGADGKFTFTAGKEADFRIGNLSLGKTTPVQVVSPADLVGRGSLAFSHQISERLVLLQGLDEDGKPDNGIQISDASRKTLAGLPAGKEFDAVNYTLDDLKKDLPALKIKDVSGADALEHFAKSPTASYGSIAVAAHKLEGYWRSECEGGFRAIHQLRKTGHNTLEVGDWADQNHPTPDCSPSSVGVVQGTVNKNAPVVYTFQIVGYSIRNGHEVTSVIRRKKGKVVGVEHFTWEPLSDYGAWDNPSFLGFQKRVKDLRDWQ